MDYLAEIYKQLNKLTQTEKKELFQSLNIETTKEDTFHKQLENTRFAKGLSCPFCGETHIKRNGKNKKGHQRYLCHGCTRTFGVTSSSIFAGTRYPDKWFYYFELMLQGLSLRKIAVELEIHLSTAFYWRHKILLALSTKLTEGLNGIVEADETYVLESKKGKNQVKKIEERPARKRGGKAKKRGISCEQVSILTATDRNGNSVLEVAGFGKISSQTVDEILHFHLEDVSTFCSDAAPVFTQYTKNQGFEHCVLNGSKGERVKKGIFHIQTINACHKRLKEWLRPFSGVATKYLNQYLAWFQFLEQHKKNNLKGLKSEFFTDIFTNSWHIKTLFLQAV
jgi:transposase-like protein